DTPPDPETIAKAVTDICGVRVIVAELRERDDIFCFRAELAVECERKETLEIFCYQPEAIRKFAEGWSPPFGPTRDLHSISTTTQESQRLTLRYYNGIDLTLWMVTLLATERLGGVPDAPLDDELRKTYGRPITLDELQQRLRKGRRRQKYQS